MFDHRRPQPQPDEFRNFTAPDLIQIIRKQRDHYGDALLKIARLARKMSHAPRAIDFHNLADIALQMRETHGLGDTRSEAPASPPGRLGRRPVR